MREAEPPLEPPSARMVPSQRTRPSLVWIVPIVAALAGAWVAATRVLGAGPVIEIVFDSAEGLEAGKTNLQYNGVQVGTLTTVRLSDDRKQVLATAQMAPHTEDLCVDGTHFWVVRPRISGANVTGLGTLISGAYIGMEIGSSKTAKRKFVALETPPVVAGNTPGRFFVLHTRDLGSLDTGTPLFFRRLQVGEVSSYSLNADGTALDVRVFVKAPYDKYVKNNTRFWQASGIDVSLGASGLSLQTQSILSILIGGIAFEAPELPEDMPVADAETQFTLFADRKTAFATPAREPEPFVLVFRDSMRGLDPGAPVEFRGIPIGEVVSIDAQFDAQTLEFSAPVKIVLDAERLGVQLKHLHPGADREALRRKLLDKLVSGGVRAQLQTASVLTGALFVEFDFFPDEAPVSIDWSQTPVQLPTVPGDIQAIEQRITGILKKIDQLPIKQIGEDVRALITDVNRTLGELDRTLASARKTVDHADKLIEPNSVLGAELGNTLQEVNRAARGLRVLTDYLERHPEALIRGKTGGN